MSQNRDQVKLRASGKLMISGEYLVLDGARTWAIPTKYGQALTANPSPGAGLKWRSVDHNQKVWFEGLWDREGKLIDFTDSDTAETLHNLLHFSKLKGNNPFSGWNVSTEVDFPREWGLGTSSSLVALISKWLNVDPFELFDSSMTGSGYDVAVAYYNRGCVYRKGEVRKEIVNVDHVPTFVEHLYFVYSGKKQSSKSEVLRYANIDLSKRTALVPEVNKLTQELLTTKQLSDFQIAMRQHESLLGTILERKTLNEEWVEIDGAMKHLGAWGGDFFLLASDKASDLDLIRERGAELIIPWKEMMLDY